MLAAPRVPPHLSTNEVRMMLGAREIESAQGSKRPDARGKATDARVVQVIRIQAIVGRARVLICLFTRCSV